MSSLNPSEQRAGTDKPVKLVHFHWVRFSLFLFFLFYAYVVGRGLMPLPDEPPRINFMGLFCATMGLVIAIQMLLSRQRAFLFLVLAFLPIAAGQLAKRVKFLEMMLEPKVLEFWLRHSLMLVFLLLATPYAFRLFDRGFGGKQPAPPLFFKKGIPF